MWVHGKVAGMGWRAPFECAYHRCSRRGCSSRHLLHHLLILHSTRRRAPREAISFQTYSSSASSFGESRSAVRCAIASSVGLRSAIRTDAPSSRVSPRTMWCLRQNVRIPQI